MSSNSDIGAYVALAIGAGAILLANRRKVKLKRKDRTGDVCDPLEEAPNGYICVSEDDDFVLRPEARKFLGFGSYPDRKAVDTTLARLGFSDDLTEFQTFISQTSRWNLRLDGVVDADTMAALAESEELLEAGKWRKS